MRAPISGEGSKPGLANLRAGRLLLALAVTAALIAACSTVGGQNVRLTHWDGADHVLVFTGLAAYARRVFPAVHDLAIGAGLLGFGLLIEALQMLPWINRSAEASDLGYDAVGIAMGLSIAAVLRASR